MNTGSVFGGRPSLGAWATYGLGTVNQSLPGFVVLKIPNQPSSMVFAVGDQVMPAGYQGVLLEPGEEPIANLNLPNGVSRNGTNENSPYSIRSIASTPGREPTQSWKLASAVTS